MGCTDHAFYRQRKTFTENTVASIRKAFASGADFVEVDAVCTSDGTVLVLHNVRPEDHFFKQQPPALLNTLPYEAFSHMQSGFNGEGEVATLAEVLAVVKEMAPNPVSYAVNIELKGTQDTNQPWDGEVLAAQVKAMVEESGVEAERILFSSFALQNLMAMAALLPRARYGLLFATREDEAPMYAEVEGFGFRYLLFTEGNVAEAREAFAAAVPAATLGYLHPEVSTLTEERLRQLGADGWGFNTWGLFEQLDEARLAHYRCLVDAAEEAGVSLGLICDDVAEIRKLVDKQ